MDKLNQDEIQLFISEKVITPFYEKRLDKLSGLNLSKILARKNPYLFKAKNIETAEELVRYILDAFLSSQEETIFGNLMEELAIFVCKQVYSGVKAEQGKFGSIDLIFDKDGKTYILFRESDPVSKDGKNRWQEGIDKWVEENHGGDPIYHPPGSVFEEEKKDEESTTPTPSPTPTETPTPTPTPII